MRPAIRGLLLAGAAALVVAGCELEQVEVAVPEETVVAEVFLRVEDGRGGAMALLHRSIGHSSRPVDGARIVVRADGGPEAGREAVLEEAPPAHCLARVPSAGFDAGCYQLPAEERDLIRPGRSYRVDVELPSGGRLEGGTSMPGDFQIVEPASGSQRVCGLAPRTLLPLVWTSADGAWAYLPEASLEGLRQAFQSEGIEIAADPAVLVGLSVSEADTTITFPSEFGVFDRLTGERELLLALSEGLPAGTDGRIVVSALDRNATNWSRGAGFHPSGWVRIPSLVGDGTGVVGATVVRSVHVAVDEEGRLPPCTPEEGE